MENRNRKKIIFFVLQLHPNSQSKSTFASLKKDQGRYKETKMSKKNDSLLQIIDHPYQDLMNHTKDTFNGR